MPHIRIALREAALTNRARPWRLIVAILLLAPLLALPPALEIAAAVSLDTLLAAEEELGRSVLIVEREGGDLDGAQCDAVAAQDGVEAAGGVTAPTVVGVGPDSLVSTRRVAATSGYLRALGYEPPFEDAVAGFDLGRELSIADGAPVHLSDPARVRMSVAVDSRRAEARSRWVTVVASSLPAVRQCWVVARPPTLAAVEAAIPAFFPTANDLRVSTLRGAEISEQAVATWSGRPSQWLFAAAGASAALVTGLVLWPRRHEYALYRLLGASRPAVTLMAAAEAMIIVTSSTLIAAPTTLAVIVLLGADPVEYASLALIELLLTLAVLATLIVAVAVGMASGRPADVLRERA